MNVKAVETAKANGVPRMLPTALPPRGSVINALAAEDQVLLNRLLSEPVDYMSHPDFTSKPIEQKLFGGATKLVDRMATRFVERADPITDAITLGERVPALSYEQESHLFMRYNFCRKRVADILSEFAGKHEESKLITILRRTWSKMSERGRQAALELALPEAARALIEKALAE